jgi:hypothetical protein
LANELAITTDEKLPLFRQDVRDRVEHFAGGRLSDGVSGQRERSYDHCYNHFANTVHPTRDMEKSCAVLGFYLASWGMYRGSSFLFKETNSTHFIPVVEYVEEHRETLTRIDVNNYDVESLAAIRTAYSDLRRLLLPGGNTALTLVTKVLVAVTGCVPAYDTYFRAGVRKVAAGISDEKFRRLSMESLGFLAEFYRANRQVVDELRDESATWKFMDSSPSGDKLTRAKILDMYFFDLGFHG